ncbi:MAG: DUF2079 domain-containing protein [Actinomycetota bacterium]|nr:DUF2079 domain-containing protein [Actinomycetota bacterium]
MTVAPPPEREWALPLTLAGATFAWLYLVAMLRAYTLLGGYDLATFSQAAWLISSGEAPFVTIRGLHLLGDHAYPIFYPIAWLTWVLPTVPTLLAVQAAALAAGIVPLWALARRVAGLGVPATAGLCVAYAAYPALHNVNFFDFHPEVVAVPALLGAVLFALTDRWWPYAGCVALALACREDISLVVLFLGVLLALQGRRRAGVATIAAGLGWLVVTTQVIQPHFAGTFVQAAFLERYGDGIGEIVATMAGDPVAVLGDLLTAQNAFFVAAMLAPVLFLPLLAPSYLLPVVPLEMLYLLSSRATAHTIEAQYTVSAIAVVFVATTMALPKVCAWWAPRRKTLPSWAPAVALAAAAVVGHTALANDSVLTRPWGMRSRDGVDQARLAAAELIPPDAAVSGTDRMWPLVAERRTLYNFPSPWERYEASNDPIPVEVRRAEVDYLLLDTVDRAQWDPGRAEALDRIVRQTGARLVFDRSGIRVYALTPGDAEPDGG